MASKLTPEYEKVFGCFDANGDGKISLQELSDALSKLGSVSAEELQCTMAEIDTDGDGFIDKAEFATFCEANPGLMNDVASVFG